MEIIAKVSKGTVMDQIYLPKQRSGFPVGSYVLIKPALERPEVGKPLLYGTKKIEPIKIDMAKRIFALINRALDCSNIIVTGSFAKAGLKFKDIDILVVSEEKKMPEKELTAQVEQETGVPAHVLFLTDKELSLGAARDPLYMMMLSRCIAQKRFTYHLQKRIIDYKLLDLDLLGSKTVFYSFDFMSGDDIYYAVRNMVAVALFMVGKISAAKVEKEIQHIFSPEEDIRRKSINKREFLKKYKEFYEKTFSQILKIAYDTEQKKAS